MTDLFTTKPKPPLAERLRPKTLEEFVGQRRREPGDPPHGGDGQRRHRQCRPAGAASGTQCRVGLRQAGLTRRRDTAGSGGDLPRSGPPAAYAAWDQAKALVKRSGSQPVPLHLRNAPTKLMKQMGYHEGYRYAHDEPNGVCRWANLFSRGRGTAGLVPAKGQGRGAQAGGKAYLAAHAR